MTSSESRSALRIALLYVLSVGLIDVLSDTAAAVGGIEPHRLVSMAVAKDSIFVFFTAMLVYGLLRRELASLKRAEAERRASDARLIQVLNVAPDAVIVVNEDQRVVLFNKAAEQIFGYSTVEVMGQPLDLFLPRQFVEIHRRQVSDFASASESARWMGERQRIFGRRKDRSEFPAEAGVSKSVENGQIMLIVIVRDVTEREATEAALRESEERYRSIITVMQEGIVLQEANGVIRTCNASAERILGLSADQMMGRTSLDPRWQAIHEDGSPFPGDTHPAMITLRTGQPLSNVVMGVHKTNGTITWTSINSQPLFRAGETRPYGVVTSFADITERKHAEQALRESEERYRSLYDNSIDGILLTAPDGSVLAANAAACQIFGRTEGEICQIGRTGLVDLSDPRVALALEERARTGGFRRELFLIRNDGARFPAEVSSSVFKDSDGQFKTSMIIRDITERKQAEEALRVSETRFRGVFENAPIAIALEDMTGRILEVNSALERMLGYSRDELQNVEPADYTFPDDVKPDHDLFQELVAGQRESYQLEKRFIRKDGQMLWGRVTTSAAYGPTHCPQFVIAMAEDITARKHAEAALQEREENYRSIVTSTADGLFVYDLEGRLVDCNPAAYRMHGYTSEEIYHLRPAQYIHADSMPAFVRLLEAVKAGREFRERAVHLRRDSTPFHVEVIGSPFIYRGQTYALAVVRDVTEQAQAYQLLEQRVEERTRELSTLLEISRTVASTLELKPLLGLILDELQVMIDYTSASLFTLEGEALVLAAYCGPQHPEQVLQFHVPVSDPTIKNAMLGRDEPILIADVMDETPAARNYRRMVGEPVRESIRHVRASIWVPLVVKERVIGGLHVAHSEPGHLTERHASLAHTIAHQAAIAIENAKLYEQAQEFAAFQERQRLARELHDAVTQTLFSASLIAEVLPRLWEVDQSEGREYLEDLRRLTRGALAEMRALLLELRPSALNESDLSDLLCQLADAITGRTRLPVTMSIEMQHPLPPDVKVALYRVAQEALNNVTKHAGASHVTVSLRSVPSPPGEEGTLGVELCICDDGSGFDVAHASPEHFGLGIMRERAEAIGAVLTIDSQIGRGTNITVVWRGQVTQ